MEFRDIGVTCNTSLVNKIILPTVLKTHNTALYAHDVQKTVITWQYL